MIKFIIASILASILAGAIFIPSSLWAAVPGEEVIETVTVQPNEEKEIVVESSVELKIGWRHKPDAAGKQPSGKVVKALCPLKKCLELTNPTKKSTLASLYGSSMKFQPQDGKVVALIKNVEVNPISVQIYKSEPKEK